MTRQEKIEWMAMWCVRYSMTLVLEGEVGLGRSCVGVLVGDTFPDYMWYNDETYDREDSNGDVWCPKNAYHKHTCVAVLGHGEEPENQLYEWLKWFEDNGFTLEVKSVPENLSDPIKVFLGQHKTVRMVRGE